MQFKANINKPWEPIPTGRYELVITKHLKSILPELRKEYFIQTEKVEKEEFAAVLTEYLQKILRQLFLEMKGIPNSIETQIQLCTAIIQKLIQFTQNTELNNYLLNHELELLTLLLPLPKSKNGQKITSDTINTHIPAPITGLTQNTLFTGADEEPELYNELQKEILSANQIDFLISFIRWPGLQLILPQLEEFTKKTGNKLRVITTSYMGYTSPKAIRELFRLPNTEIKISYDTQRTRLHAKAYFFQRNTGFHTAYIGSSNLTQTAITKGLEWNVKITSEQSPDLIQKYQMTFANYWNNPEFEQITSQEDIDEFQRILEQETNQYQKQKTSPDSIQYHFDLRPYWFQQEILMQLAAERELRNRRRNLIVAATGTGKTLMAAFDFRDYISKWKQNPLNPSNTLPKLLFIAHRSEILEQSIYRYRSVLKDYNFGTLFNSKSTEIPESLSHVFISIQLCNHRNIEDWWAPDYFDYIIIDEFHHAAALSYTKVLRYFTPDILLGLTATPERMDGQDILSYFDGQIAAELRLFDAINQKLLSPFHYFVISDTVDLNQIQWKQGGYDKRELEMAYVNNQERVDLILQSLEDKLEDLTHIKGLGFCTGVDHAHYMAKQFSLAGIPSIAVDGRSSSEIRDTAPKKLREGTLKFIFIADLYNEGIDIPEINTILFLRPTESLTIFLQQLGRGLRLSEDKTHLNVFDFVGRAHARYSFQEKFRALIGKTERSLKREIEQNFPHHPKGCFISMERVAQDVILENIKASLDYRKNIVKKLERYSSESAKPLTLDNFLEFYQINIHTFYSRGTWFELLILANLHPRPSIQIMKSFKIFRKGLNRLLWVNSRRFLLFIREVFTNYPKNHDILDQFTEEESLFLNMFYYTLFDKDIPDVKSPFKSIHETFEFIFSFPLIVQEIQIILDYNLNQINFIDKPVQLGYPCPLDLHCRYTSNQVLAAMGVSTPKKARTLSGTGVFYVKARKTDLLFVTLNKTEKEFSPTTLYQDYSISETLFHWQSQGATSPETPVGQRYLDTALNSDNKILLFVKKNKKELGKTAPFHFLGPVGYVEHNGTKPINIVWKLSAPIPNSLRRHE